MARMATEFAVIDAPMARPKIALRCRAVRPSLITFRHNARRGVMRMGPHLVVLALAVAVGGALGWGGLSIDVGFAPRSEQVAQPSVDDVAAGYPAPPAGAPAWLPHNTASPLAEATPAADASTDPQLASLVSATDSEAPSAS